MYIYIGSTLEDTKGSMYIKDYYDYELIGKESLFNSIGVSAIYIYIYIT